MPSRFTPILIGLMFVVVAFMLYDLSVEPRCQLTYANFERLEMGMTFAEAVAIMGEPTGVDETFEGQRWVTWRSPFDLNSWVGAVFTTTPDKLTNKEAIGTLLKRPRRFPEEIVKRPIPSIPKMHMRLGQVTERGKTLMAAPPKKTVDPLFLP